MDVNVAEPIDRFVDMCKGMFGIANLEQRRTLVCGSNMYDTGKEDRRKRYRDCIGIDQIAGDSVDRVANLEDLSEMKSLGLFDHIECLSVLEHARRPWIIARNLRSTLTVGGTIVVQVPFIWRVHNYPSDYWRFTAEGISELFKGLSSVVTAHCYSDGEIDIKGKVPKIDVEGKKFMARTEVFMFGVK